jgi:hypothetical protein
MNNSQIISDPNMAGPQTSERQQQSPRIRQTLFTRLEKIASASQVLRGFGACAIIASMSLFMLQGWAEGNDITRYLKLLAQTGLLTTAGLVLSILIKEFKGARVFFGLALISVVANFTILGSLSYSMFAMDMQIVDYPESMKWEVTQTAVFLPVFLGALSLLSAVAYFAFSIFSRQISKPLTISFLGLSALLLVPVRAPLIAVGLAAIALWGALMLIKRLSKADASAGATSANTSRALLMTKETKASLAVLLLPGLIILARALSFYNIDDATLLAFSGLLLLVVRSIRGLVNANALLKRLVEMFQFAIAGFIAFMTTQVLPLGWNSIDVFISAIIFLGFAFEQLRSDSGIQWKALVVNLTNCAVVPIALINASLEYEFIYSIQALLVCGFAFALALTAGNSIGKTLFSRAIAMLGMIVAGLIVLFDLVQLAQLGNWVIIGFSGAILIIAASLYERFGLKLLAK